MQLPKEGNFSRNRVIKIGEIGTISGSFPRGSTTRSASLVGFVSFLERIYLLPKLLLPEPSPAEADQDNRGYNIRSFRTGNTNLSRPNRHRFRT